MEELTPNYILNNYTDKINSVGYKIKQAIGHPYEQIRLVLQLKIYIKSMIKDLMKMSDKCFDDDSTTFDSMSSLYDTVYGILTTITTTGSGVMIDTTGSDTDVVMTKDNNKDAIISKFKMLLAGMDKTLRYLQSMNNQKINMTAYESLTFLEEVNIADDSYLNRLGSPANESFFDIINQ